MKTIGDLLELPAEEVCTIKRHRRGRGFEYFDKTKTKVNDRQTLRHFQNLAIPPMWAEVRISHNLNSHVQAFGMDKKGRRQYIYHSEWQLQRQQSKFRKLQQFSRDLPSIRRQYLLDIEKGDWGIRHVSAIAARILDTTGMRIGNTAYTEQNHTYGLSTIRERHINRSSGAINFDFQGKHNKRRLVSVDDPELVHLIETCSEKPGYSLLRYQVGRQWIDISSDDINDYIRSISTHHYSSKFFRTWVATRLAVEMFDSSAQLVNDHPRRRFKSTLIKKVAKVMGNTPSVCEAYYIHPDVLSHLLAMFKHDNGHRFMIAAKLLPGDGSYSDAEGVAMNLFNKKRPSK